MEQYKNAAFAENDPPKTSDNKYYHIIISYKRGKSSFLSK